MSAIRSVVRAISWLSPSGHGWLPWALRATLAWSVRSMAFGKSYLEDNGVSRHVSKGLFWLLRAALSGDAAAADALEYFYEDALYMPDPQGRMRLFWASYAEDLREPFESTSR